MYMVWLDKFCMGLLASLIISFCGLGSKFVVGFVVFCRYSWLGIVFSIINPLYLDFIFNIMSISAVSSHVFVNCMSLKMFFCLTWCLILKYYFFASLQECAYFQFLFFRWPKSVFSLMLLLSMNLID